MPVIIALILALLLFPSFNKPYVTTQKQLLNSSVRIKSHQTQEVEDGLPSTEAGYLLGSGCYISSNLVITAAHVVRDSEFAIMTSGFDNHEVFIDKIWMDDAHDLAILHVTVPGKPVKIDFLSRPEVGDDVQFFGSGNSQLNSYHKGYVSFVDDGSIYGGMHADINAGDSGSCVVDKNFELIGVVSALQSTGELGTGMELYIDKKYIPRLLEKARKYNNGR